MAEQSELDTELDRAHMAMTQGGEVARLRFYERLADSHLIVALEREPVDDNISPELFETGDGRFVLVFDREERLVQFTGKVTPYAGLTGRVLMQMLAGQGIGLGFNLEVAPSSVLIPAEAVDWLNQTLESRPDQVEARIIAYQAPDSLPQDLLDGLAAKLARSGGLAKAAYLVAVTYESGGTGHLLGFVGAVASARAALAKAVGEALTFSGMDRGALDVGFFDAGDPVVEHLAQQGFCLELPPLQAARPPVFPAPGSDKDKPPILR